MMSLWETTGVSNLKEYIVVWTELVHSQSTTIPFRPGNMAFPARRNLVANMEKSSRICLFYLLHLALLSETLLLAWSVIFLLPIHTSGRPPFECREMLVYKLAWLCQTLRKHISMQHGDGGDMKQFSSTSSNFFASCPTMRWWLKSRTSVVVQVRSATHKHSYIHAVDLCDGRDVFTEPLQGSWLSYHRSARNVQGIHFPCLSDWAR